MELEVRAGQHAPEIKAKSRRSARVRSEALGGYLFVLPSALLFLVFIAGPIVASALLTFYHLDGLTNRQFIGLDNYRRRVHDPLLRTVLFNTVQFAIGSVALKMGLALISEVLVDRYLGSFLRTLFRAVIFFPVIVSGVAIGIIWGWLMSTDLGLVNYYRGLVSLGPVKWLDSSSQAMFSLVLVDVWRNVGFSFVVSTAGLQGISRDLYEASSIDGAGGWSLFRSITLPMLSPPTFFLLTINMTSAFQFFDLSYVMTQGGPGDVTRTIVYDIYNEGFQFFHFGYASTVALLLFLILAVVTFLQLRNSRRWVFYG